MDQHGLTGADMVPILGTPSRVSEVLGGQEGAEHGDGAEARRLRDKAHLRFVASQPCLVCGRQPSDPHHLRFSQPRALGLKVSDEFTVPLCRGHHRQLHQAGNEVVWWEGLKINALDIAKGLWAQTHPKSAAADTEIPARPNDETNPILPVDPQ